MGSTDEYDRFVCREEHQVTHAGKTGCKGREPKDDSADYRKLRAWAGHSDIGRVESCPSTRSAYGQLPEHIKFGYLEWELMEDRTISTVYVLSDYSRTAQEIVTLVRRLLREHNKTHIRVETISRKEAKSLLSNGRSFPDEATVIIGTPILERYIIYDAQDPSTGFYREINCFGRKNVVIIVGSTDDIEANQNYHSRFKCLWKSTGRQQFLEMFARSGRFFSMKKDLKPWQKRTLSYHLRLKDPPENSREAKSQPRQ
eukprot:m.24693 g.24693  ORF g.24693 m.24693 type:complete len:257 (+) comp28669_c0_seq4:1282-2052(+)